MNTKNSIKLNDILRLDASENVKVRLNVSAGSWHALDYYHNNKNLLMIGNFHNSQKKIWFKEGDIVVGLARIEGDDWLLFDISRIVKSYNKLWDGVDVDVTNTFYEYDTMTEYAKYFGRLIVRYHKTGQYVTQNFHAYRDKYTVKELLSDSFDALDIFPGYENVNLSWSDLARVTGMRNWQTALENQKGVYLIVDSKTGKMYVGSAYGADMLLGRWKSYVSTGHGGNVELKVLDFAYIKDYFRYSILDIYKSTVDDSIVLARESWWKRMLLTQEFGYNKN